MKNILAITYWSYKEPLVHSGALPYLKIISGILPKGSRLYLFTLEKENFRIHPDEETAIKAELAAYNIVLVKKTYYNFGVKAILSWLAYFTHLLYLCYAGRITHIHCWCTPAGGIGYFLSILTGKKLIIDSYEPHAETMVETGNWKRNSLAFRILFFLEKLQSQQAHSVFSLSEGMRKYAKEKYRVELKNRFVRSTCVDFNLFRHDPNDRSEVRQKLGIEEDVIVGIYAGKIGGIYLEHEIFRMIHCAAGYWKNKFKMLMLTDISMEAMTEYLQKHDIDLSLVDCFFSPHSEVKRYLAAADFALCPVKPVPTKKYCSPIKTGEYWAMGLPVIIPDNIGDDSGIILRENIGAVLGSLNEEEYLNAVKKINRILNSGNLYELKEKIHIIAHTYRNFKNTEAAYKTMYGLD